MSRAWHGDHLVGSVSDEHERRDAAAERRFMLEHHRPDGWIDARLGEALGRGPVVDAVLAHVLAERTRPEPGSEVAEFLVYDILRPTAVLSELEPARDLLPPRWFEALQDFVADAADRGFPVDHTGPEARPMLYVTRGSTNAGAWVDAAVDDRALLASLLALPGNAEDRRWTVRARMGFYDVYPLTSPEIWLMNGIAQGIARHGEAYAAYAEHSLQQGMSELDFLARYRGQAPTLDHFVFDHAEREGWLQAIAKVNDTVGLTGAVRLDIEALRTHLFASGYSAEAGRNGFFVFGPPVF